MPHKEKKFKHYIERFNQYDDEKIVNHIDNESVWGWMLENIPFFECPDKELEELYYFRWWTYRKHIRHTSDGFVITEFLQDVPWAGKHNTISCAAGHHFREGRWLRNSQYLDDYARFFLQKDGEPRKYSFWVADSIYAKYLVDGNKKFVIDLLPDLIKNYQKWESGHLCSDGLYWQIDDRDGEEFMIGGSGCRPTINSYMYGDALAIAKIANIAGKKDINIEFDSKAASIKQAVLDKLWDKKQFFFKTIPCEMALKKHKAKDMYKKYSGTKQKIGELVDVCELIGYIPWYFNMPDEGYEKAWRLLFDKDYFYTSFGPTTAERKHKDFLRKLPHTCLWNGYIWPYATSQTLTAMANLLKNYNQDIVTKEDYFNLLTTYAKSQHFKLEDGTIIPWIDESIDPATGELYTRNEFIKNESLVFSERGKYYNHSTFCDLIINGLIGFQPEKNGSFTLNSLLPYGKWDYYCLENVPFQGKLLTIRYDSDGKYYNLGKGLKLSITNLGTQ